MALILLRFDEKGNVIGGRIRFVSRAPHVPKKEVALDADRIYAIYKSTSGYYVVYDTENIDFYRAYRAETLPSDAELIDKIEITVLRCATCGAKVEWDADEPYCPRAPDEHFSFKEVSEVVYRAKEFDWSQVERGSPETVNVPITSENVSYIAGQILDRYNVASGSVRRGYIGEAGHYTVIFVKKVREVDSQSFRIVEGIGYVEESHWDEVPQIVEAGYYVATYITTPDGTHVEFAKLRDLRDEDIETFIEAGQIYLAEKFFGSDKVAETLRRKPELINRVPASELWALAKYGFTDAVRKHILEHLDRCKGISCVDSMVNKAVRYKVLDSEVKSKILKVLHRVIEAENTSIVYTTATTDLIRAVNESGDKEFAEEVRKMLEPITLKVLNECTDGECIRWVVMQIKAMEILDKVREDVIRIAERVLQNTDSMYSIETVLKVINELGSNELKKFEGIAKRRIIEIITSKTPQWADATFIILSNERYEVYPLKKSQYTKGYYYSQEWRKIASGYIDTSLSKLFGEKGYFIVTRTGKVIPAEIRSSGRYISVTPKIEQSTGIHSKRAVHSD